MTSKPRKSTRPVRTLQAADLKLVQGGVVSGSGTGTGAGFVEGP